MNRVMIDIENVTKTYKLGQINGTTLRDELQRKRAKRLRREDPTSVIGTDESRIGETFKALDSVSFKVYEGERVGIIGHNGAGKSTLLKLISRVTAPSGGEIGLNGRVTSMLEVGTGFHGELTGRENIYMNGAILGMTKKEISEKIEDIIEFSECRQFIDTPVKRYSSGMYVKLAFSVAAHLNSEVMIMDEVLAVGDMAFQKKCLNKMNDVSRREGRTILYVSHNMNTIRQLCDRCIVLEKGKVVFDGDVDKAINLYMNSSAHANGVDIDISTSRMEHLPQEFDAKMTRVHLVEKESSVYEFGERIVFDLSVQSKKQIDNLCLRLEVSASDGTYVGTTMLHNFASLSAGSENIFRVSAALNGLVKGEYAALLVLYKANQFGVYDDLDAVDHAFSFTVCDTKNKMHLNWNNRTWGKIKFDDLIITKQ